MWVPAHTGILGNESADIAAKEATGWRADGRQAQRAAQPAGLYSLRTTSRTYFHKEANRRWNASWQTETTGRTSHRHTLAPTKKVLQLHNGRRKRHSALLIHLRTEKIGLRDFLFNRKVPDIPDPKCECGEGRQTVAHVLLRCRRHKDLRRREFGHHPGRHDLRALLGTHKLATKAIQFMEHTRILGQFRIAEEETTPSTGGRL